MVVPRHWAFGDRLAWTLAPTLETPRIAADIFSELPSRQSHMYV